MRRGLFSVVYRLNFEQTTIGIEFARVVVYLYKDLKMKTQIIFALGLIAASATAQANLITNGDFEASPPAALTSGTFYVVNVGSSDIAGWTVTGAAGRSVDLIQNAYGSINNISVDLMGSPGPAMISQSFSVVAGQTYQLDFDLSRNGNSLHTVLFNFGTLSETISPVIAGNHVTRLFTATSTGSATLDFSTSGTDIYSGPVIDNVVVAAVPLPGTLALISLGLGFCMVRRSKK
jgi:choice-of-anchor C domain-containing protein